jgi:hypothetical protein
MKPHLLPLALLTTLLPVSAAQTLLQIGQTYNTGYVGGTALAAGASDLDFTLNGNAVPVVPSPIPPEWITVSGAQFISPTVDQQYPANPPAGDPKGTYVYEAVLASTFSVPTTLTVSGSFAADDYAYVSIDGLYLGMTPGFTSLPAGYSETTSLDQTFTVQAGSLPVTIDFVVFNKDDTTDGIAVNPTGLLVSDLKFTVDSMEASPEPKSWAMMAGGLVLLLFIQRLRRRAND